MLEPMIISMLVPGATKSRTTLPVPALWLLLASGCHTPSPSHQRATPTAATLRPSAVPPVSEFTDPDTAVAPTSSEVTSSSLIVCGRDECNLLDEVCCVAGGKQTQLESGYCTSKPPVTDPDEPITWMCGQGHAAQL